MRIKDVTDVGHILGRELRTCDKNTEEAGITACIGAMRKHLGYVYTTQHVKAFDEAVTDALEWRWA